jgi:hypothetical protein
MFVSFNACFYFNGRVVPSFSLWLGEFELEGFVFASSL